MEKLSESWVYMAKWSKSGTTWQIPPHSPWAQWLFTFFKWFVWSTQPEYAVSFNCHYLNVSLKLLIEWKVPPDCLCFLRFLFRFPTVWPFFSIVLDGLAIILWFPRKSSDLITDVYNRWFKWTRLLILIFPTHCNDSWITILDTWLLELNYELEISMRW